MPIRFRCGYCNRLLGIARRKAGSETTCPHCGYTVTVPDDPGDDPAETEDLDALLNPTSTTDQPNPELPSSSTRSQGSPPAFHRNAQASSPATNLQTAPPVVPSPSSGSPGTRTTKASAPQSTSTATSDSRSRDERPLFERELDAVLGKPGTTTAPQGDAQSKPIPTSGMDAMSLGSERTQIVLSVQKATAMVVIAVVLIALSFATGFLLASAK
ncbi:MAG TPA: hypothetical protein VG122_16440 [Gemmata sp.]|nr:hypothetical protein [Gemmata sp.]